MISVTEAEHIIQQERRDYGTEPIALEKAVGRTLAENILADRDFPPYDRVTMDGIAIRYDDFANGQRSFTVKATQAAGDTPTEINKDESVEIMTGASLPDTADTIIRYEDVAIKDGIATINIDTIKQGQNIHYKGTDKKEKELLASSGQLITPALINTAASVGKATLLVKKLPRVVVISTGEELVPVDAEPSPIQVRRSNSYAVAAVLEQYKIIPEMLHLQDDEAMMTDVLQKCLQEYDVLILSGGVSMGKYDHLPTVLEKLNVEKKFHKVRQRPGKPFWFGVAPQGQLIFAFPGNPVSTFMCMYRYCMPWLQVSLGMKQAKPVYAVLAEDYSFQPQLQYFLQVKISSSEDGRLMATPYEGHGSGDFVNLLYTDAFMELPEQGVNFKKGEAHRIWPFKPIVS